MEGAVMLRSGMKADVVRMLFFCSDFAALDLAGQRCQLIRTYNGVTQRRCPKLQKFVTKFQFYFNLKST